MTIDSSGLSAPTSSYTGVFTTNPRISLTTSSGNTTTPYHQTSPSLQETPGEIDHDTSSRKKRVTRRRSLKDFSSQPTTPSVPDGHNRSPRSSLNRIGDNLHSYASRYLDSIRSKRSPRGERSQSPQGAGALGPLGAGASGGGTSTHLLTFRQPNRLSPASPQSHVVHGVGGGGVRGFGGGARSLSPSPLPQHASQPHPNPLSMTPNSNQPSVWRTSHSPNSNWKSDRYYIAPQNLANDLKKLSLVTLLPVVVLYIIVFGMEQTTDKLSLLFDHCNGS